MSKRGANGFTLIELLVVIAIILILAGIAFTVGSGVREKAHIVSVQSDFRNLNTKFVEYYTANLDTYPPMYGYLKDAAKDKTPAELAALQNAAEVAGTEDDFYEKYFCVQPYSYFIGSYGEDLVEDDFSEGYDTDRDDSIAILEYLPVGTVDVATGNVTFEPEVYKVTDGFDDAGLDDEKSRPYVYIPINKDQFKKYRKYLYDLYYADPSNPDLHALYANRWPSLNFLHFPPAKYDAYVLISVGPFGHTGGLLTLGPPEGINKSDWVDPTQYGLIRYHINALRAYFLATRDINANGELDFDFISRTQRDETEYLDPKLPDPDVQRAHKDFWLPVDYRLYMKPTPPETVLGPGPMIYKCPEAD
ncbi:MAG TPA: prepilin-type N-terminal cleavage/methylation domain-containing protein [Candidatus Hydrogenedentes bacterium]|nr:prepilin-type N-terminal cleavage/methylation domain-containing protein [Candidatus Hydrogenedentota bacterium]HIJ72787.1 prepilin-type N-terminal cleavage/methylation domain-containing protein [Candidatus Hydrogenedentota bacterium]